MLYKLNEYEMKFHIRIIYCNKINFLQNINYNVEYMLTEIIKFNSNTSKIIWLENSDSPYYPTNNLKRTARTNYFKITLERFYFSLPYTKVAPFHTAIKANDVLKFATVLALNKLILLVCCFVFIFLIFSSPSATFKELHI